MTRERSLTYKVWHAMKKRCTDQKYQNYPRYGGRGIKVCDRWLESFDAFVEDMGFQPSGKILDRIDNDGDYTPGNCRWATPAESNRNHSRNTVVTARGKTQCITDWADELGMSVQVLSKRLLVGWSIEEAISTPVLRRKSTRGRKFRLLQGEHA